jgi:hypothetical protein
VAEGMKYPHIQGRYWLTDGRRKMGKTNSRKANVAENRLLAYQQYAGKLEKRIRDLTFLAILFACTTLALFAYIGLKGI